MPTYIRSQAANNLLSSYESVLCLYRITALPTACSIENNYYLAGICPQMVSCETKKQTCQGLSYLPNLLHVYGPIYGDTTAAFIVVLLFSYNKLSDFQLFLKEPSICIADYAIKFNTSIHLGICWKCWVQNVVHFVDHQKWYQMRPLEKEQRIMAELKQILPRTIPCHW